VDEAVTPDHIAQVVSRWTGVPVDKMLEGERAKLLKMEEELARRSLGQREAVAAVATAVRRARAGLQDPSPDRLLHVPRPTGVGKTELTKAWPRSCSTTKRRWSESTCRNIGETFGLPL